MKNFIYVSALVLGLGFVTSCGDDDEDDDSAKTCVTCELLGIETTFCDNGDGTVTQEIGGVSQIVDLPEGVSFEDYSSCVDVEVDTDVEE